MVLEKIGSERSPIVIELKSFNGRKFIDIRKYYTDKNNNGELSPTKKGIAVNDKQLVQIFDAIGRHQKEIKSHFEVAEIDLDEINIETNIAMLGRCFNVISENATTTVQLSNRLNEKLGEQGIEILQSFILGAYRAALNTYEDDDDLEMFLDNLSHQINRISFK